MMTNGKKIKVKIVDLVQFSEEVIVLFPTSEGAELSRKPSLGRKATEDPIFCMASWILALL